MKGIINNHSALTAYRRQTAVDPVAAPQSAPRGEGTGADSSVEAARVSISPRARALASGEGAIDSQKVEQLRNAIQSGTLKFNSQLVAERMIDQSE
jgi:flagellar biosynthesis anti-sigma factor FlgM